MDRLLEGYRRFREQVWPIEKLRYEEMDRGQSPETLIVACSDSRVDPQTVFGARPGELFAVRNVAALVPPYEPDGGRHGVSAALEFGVRVLQVKRIVVLGHARCGGVKAMVEGAPELARDFVAPWMKIAEPALRAPCGERLGGPADEATLAHCEADVVRLSLDNLRTFPWIAEAESAGRLELRGFRFDIRTGVLMTVTPDGMAPVA